MIKFRLPAVAAALLATCVVAVGCGPSDLPDVSGNSDVGVECRKAADFLPDGSEKDQALEACDQIKGHSFDDVTGNPAELCDESLPEVGNQQALEHAEQICEQLQR
jgi:hypothetical protein